MAKFHQNRLLGQKLHFFFTECKKKILEKKIAIKCWFLVIFPWFFSFKRATGSRERKEGMQWNLFIFRASKMFNLLSVSLDSWSFGGATQKVTLHSFNKNVAWLETGWSYPQRTNIWKVSNDHSTLNFLRNTLLHTNVYLLQDKIFKSRVVKQ